MGEKVPYSFAFEEEFICRAAGVTLPDYYESPQVMMDAQEFVKADMERRFGLGRFVGIGPTLSAYVEATVCGGRLKYAAGGEPWLVNMPLLPDEEAVRRFCEADIDPLGGLMARNIQFYGYMRERAGGRFPVGLGGSSGPATTAGLLRGEEFFVDCLQRPELARKLLQKVTDVNIAIREIIFTLTRHAPSGMSDDYAGMLSPALFAELILPCYRRIFGRFGVARPVLHSELLTRAHVRLADEALHLAHFNAASAKRLTIADLHDAVPGRFDWQITPADFMGPKAELLAHLDRVLAEGAPHIQFYPYDNTPYENIEAVLQWLAQ